MTRAEYLEIVRRSQERTEALKQTNRTITSKLTHLRQLGYTCWDVNEMHEMLRDLFVNVAEAPPAE